MNAAANEAAFVVLIDDDPHSAHLLMRMLDGQSGPKVRHYLTEEAGEVFLGTVLNDATADWPSLVLVDLKAHSGANEAFLTRHQAMLRQKGVPLAVMSCPTDRAGRQALHDAGAGAVFFRQAELDAYRHEVSAILSFWARHQRLDAVGM